MKRRKKRSEIWETTMKTVITLTEVTQSELFSNSKKADVTQARGLLFITLSNQGLRPATIMRLCQNNGWEPIVHSTITKHIERAKKKIKEDDEFIEFLKDIKDNLGAIA